MPCRMFCCVLALGTILPIAFGRRASPADERPAEDKAADARDGPPGYVELKVRADKGRYCLMEPVFIDIEVINNSKKFTAQYFTEWGPYFGTTGREITLHVDVETRPWKVAPTRLGLYVGGSGDTMHLDPGRKQTRRLMVNAVYDMTTTGEYRIRATLPIGGGPDDEGQVWLGGLVKSNEIKVVVEDCPREPLVKSPPRRVFGSGKPKQTRP